MPRRSAEYMDGQRLHFCEAAMSCFRRKGIAATSMSDICHEAKFSMGAFYKCFKSRDELITAILNLRLERRRELLRASTWLDLRGRLRQHRERLQRDTFWREMTALVDWNQPLKLHRMAAAKAILVQIEEQLERFKAAGEIAPHFDTKRTAQLISLIFDGSLADRRVGKDFHDGLAELAEYLDFAVGRRDAEPFKDR